MHPATSVSTANTKNGARGPASSATTPPMLGPTPTANEKNP